MRLLRFLAVLIILGGAAGWFLTRPQPVDAALFAGLTPDPVNGAYVFAAAGCASCHGTAEGPDDLMAGGKRFASDFGTFVAPNISSDTTHGVGGWSDLDLASSIMRGVGQDGAHLYPAFPYTAYTKARPQDVADLIAYMRTLPASDRASEPHELAFPYTIRAGIGLWKALYLDQDWVITTTDPQLERGRYLVEALGHCAECHTPRDALGGLVQAQLMGGAPNPSGDGRIPNITPAALDWSAEEIAIYLESGFTPEFDVAGGTMAEVIANTAKLTEDDRMAIAAYLKALPPVTD